MRYLSNYHMTTEKVKLHVNIFPKTKIKLCGPAEVSSIVFFSSLLGENVKLLFSIIDHCSSSIKENRTGAITWRLLMSCMWIEHWTCHQVRNNGLCILETDTTSSRQFWTQHGGWLRMEIVRRSLFYFRALRWNAKVALISNSSQSLFHNTRSDEEKETTSVQLCLPSRRRSFSYCHSCVLLRTHLFTFWSCS